MSPSRTVIAVVLLAAGCASTASDVPPPPSSNSDGAAARPDAQTSKPPVPEAGVEGVGSDAAQVVASEAAPPPTTEAGASTGCAAAAFCDDFESDTAGMPPAASRWSVSMGCNPNTQDGPAMGGGLLVGVDDAQAHSGTKSLRVVGGDSCGYYAVSTAAFASAKLSGSQLYVRFFARFSGSPTQNHNGFLLIPSGSDHLRLGFQDQVIAWNAQMSDATLPDMDPMGTTLSAATHPMQWTCVEFHVDETNGHIEFWLDGSSVSGLSFAGTSTQGVNDQWARSGLMSLSPASLGLGWLGLNDQLTVWFDDVAVSSGRVGCQ